MNHKQMKKMQSTKMVVLPLGKLGQLSYNDAQSPMTNSTAISSHDSQYYADFGSVVGDMTSEISGLDSPVCNVSRKHSTAAKAVVKTTVSAAANAENAWKKKIKTELCHFWLEGVECENRIKEQGCGFAHG